MHFHYQKSTISCIFFSKIEQISLSHQYQQHIRNRKVKFLTQYGLLWLTNAFGVEETPVALRNNPLPASVTWEHARNIYWYLNTWEKEQLYNFILQKSCYSCILAQWWITIMLLFPGTWIKSSFNNKKIPVNVEE